VTKDGSLAAHFEHTIAITENGPEVLTSKNGRPAPAVSERRSETPERHA
jgi:hypothetical protein